MLTMKRALKNISGMMWAVWVLIILFAVFAPGFHSFQNVQNILKNTSILLIIACGMTFTIISHQVDLSPGGVATFAGMVAAYYLHQYETPGIGVILTALLIGMAVGAIMGLFNGLMIGKFKYDFWLITFATMSISFALSQVLTGGNVISGFGKNFRDIANVNFLQIPGVIWFSAAIVLITSVILYRTKFGMHVYAVGDSEQCAGQSGINVSSVRYRIFLLSGVLSGLAGVLLAAKTNSASPISGVGYEFDAVAAIFIGGTPMEGGQGGIIGTVIGALSIAAIKTGLQLVGFSVYTQQVLIGLILLIIVVADVMQEQREQKQRGKRVYK